ncbi:putative nucleotide-diphospho-sugar transferase [Falsirhodobacter algicola]|uniref:Nucleotide-diphospho-sugar transferase domain-containing protein n=1 Tax=Falsirhodobacter algicola TaxID=2692330 RepID=A0A8J8SJV8_9RHOB|nr:putative nucleotide-diphospho-sugar transferase [Falsirhodobacter algicola]QUS34856.1 hypothetical protein GR316_00375 [Falsirhodobacter algicola]
MAAQGIVFGATGRLYRKLACRAARNVRLVMPDCPIDLYTDEPPEDAVFDRVFRVSADGPRPKMEALIRSRFERTLYLDCDAVVVNDVSDIFAMLERFDIVGAHEQYGSSQVTLQKVMRDLPTAFRQINGGVLGVRRSAETTAFLERWGAEFRSRKLRFDQPLLREMLWESDLRLGVLPPEYNQMHFPFVRAASAQMMAPRILHITTLHTNERHAEPADQPFNPADYMPAPARDRFNELLRSDRTLNAPAAELRGERLRRIPLLRRIAQNLKRLVS